MAVLVERRSPAVPSEKDVCRVVSGTAREEAVGSPSILREGIMPITTFADPVARLLGLPRHRLLELPGHHRLSELPGHRLLELPPQQLGPSAQEVFLDRVAA